MRTRLAAALAASLAIGAVPSYGAMRPISQVVDPKGDARGNLGFADIVTGLWRTTGSRDGKMLVATMTLAGPPRADGGFAYELRAQAAGCGTVSFGFAPGTVSATSLGAKSFYVGCGNPGDPLGTMTFYDEVSVAVSGRTITWAIPLSVLPKEVGVGTSLTAFEAVADVAEPVTGHPAGSMPNQSVDLGSGNGRWVIR